MPTDLGGWFEHILAAHRRIASHVARTPLLESESLNASLGLRLVVKPESLQKTGSFKARGALNFVLQSQSSANNAFVGYSSGNHAQGLAYAARVVGRRAHVLMPASAPSRKVEGTLALGAEVEILADFFTQRDQRVAQMVADGAVFVPPFDHRHIIEGQGTVGLEIAQDATARDIPIDTLFIPVSGGGLLAGTAIAVRQRFPGCRIVGVEPDGFDDFARSMAVGARTSNEPGRSTLCDGLMSPRPGEVPFALANAIKPDFATVGDSDVRQAVKILFGHFNLIAEASGAAAVAAVLRPPGPYGAKPWPSSSPAAMSMSHTTNGC